ncbi:MAG: DUF975 family protein [Halanaerobiales bacterium]
MERQFMKSNYELRKIAREKLRSKWGAGALLIVIFTALTSIAGLLFFPFSFIVSPIISGPLMLGFVGCFLFLIRKNTFRYEKLFDGFSNFKSAFFTFILSSIYIFLWSLLFVVPGIIAAYRYSMAFYILYDNPELSGSEAIKASKEMMRGHKGKLFMLHFSFIGWAILCFFTFYIGFFWLMPYIQTSIACFYQNLKDIQEEISLPEKEAV